jgi:putative membrane protein
MRIRLLLASAAALALAACGSNDDTTAPPADETSELIANVPTPEATPDASTPQGFADTVAASGMYEIEAAKLAQSMGKSDKVKAFAAMMTRDHTKAGDDLKAAAGKADPAVTVAPSMTAKQQSDLEALRSAGDNFDTVYAQQQVAAHEEALSLLQTYGTSGTSDPLKAFASATAKVVQVHLDQARQLP